MHLDLGGLVLLPIGHRVVLPTPLHVVIELDQGPNFTKSQTQAWASSSFHGSRTSTSPVQLVQWSKTIHELPGQDKHSSYPRRARGRPRQVQSFDLPIKDRRPCASASCLGRCGSSPSLYIDKCQHGVKSKLPSPSLLLRGFNDVCGKDCCLNGWKC